MHHMNSSVRLCALMSLPIIFASNVYAVTTPAVAILQLTCPVDWSALADIDGPNPDQVIFGIKARDWQKNHLATMLEKTKECLNASTDPEPLKIAVWNDAITRNYSNASSSIARLDQRLRQEKDQARIAAQEQTATEKPATIDTTPSQLSEREKARQKLAVDREQQFARNAEIVAQREIEQSKSNKLGIGVGGIAALIAAWFWNKFIRTRCPKCKSTDYETTSVEEVDRWRGTKAITKTVPNPNGIKGQSYIDVTKHVATTYVKKLYSYRCRACQTEWSIEKKEEL